LGFWRCRDRAVKDANERAVVKAYALGLTPFSYGANPFLFLANIDSLARDFYDPPC
jgi:hypothetical protein